MSAGARLAVMRRAGSASPEAINAARTRSRDSATALSPRPTIMNATLPLAICTCTSTARASTPSNATVETRATIPPHPHHRPPLPRVRGTFTEHNGGGKCNSSAPSQSVALALRTASLQKASRDVAAALRAVPHRGHWRSAHESSLLRVGADSTLACWLRGLARPPSRGDRGGGALAERAER